MWCFSSDAWYALWQAFYAVGSNPEAAAISGSILKRSSSSAT
jgi:ribose/xylose/arabinose/galactoside ABC-type transport system permease subunit